MMEGVRCEEEGLEAELWGGMWVGSWGKAGLEGFLDDGKTPAFLGDTCL